MVTIHTWLDSLVSVSDEELTVINGICENAITKANEVLLKEGEVSRKMGLIIQGAVRCYHTGKDGNEKTISFAFEGMPIMEFDSFFNQRPSVVGAATMEPSIILWTDHSNFISFIERFPRYNQVLLVAMAREMAQAKETWQYLHLLSAKERYQTMCEQHPEIIKRVPLKYVASYLGITVETLSRIRAKK